MKETKFTIIQNVPVVTGSPTGDVYKLTMQGDTEEITTPGQFVNLKLEGHFLRRPISVHDVNKDKLTLLYKVVGEGTKEMSMMESGKEIMTFTGLGNGFDITDAGNAPLLIGGGIGIAPLYLLARKILEQAKEKNENCVPIVILGFRTAEEMFCLKEFEELGCKVVVTTEDGSEGIKGFVTNGMPEEFSYLYTCGPEPMLKAVFRAMKPEKSGEFSFEERMGCGFGACMGCSCKTVTGYKRICKDGPILKKNEILW